MIRVAVAGASIAAIFLASTAQAGDRKAAAAPAVAAPVAGPVQDCSVFYDDYARRGFDWGAGPGTSVGFGTFEGALPRYPENSFPNWYGICREWGRYSSTGSAARW
jgi:hypothetical protein